MVLKEGDIMEEKREDEQKKSNKLRLWQCPKCALKSRCLNKCMDCGTWMNDITEQDGE